MSDRTGVGSRITAIISLIVGISVLLISVPFLRAQSSATDWEKAAGGKLSFDAASVKPNVSGPQMGMTSNFFWGSDRKPPKGLLTGTNLPLAVYITFAYKLDNTQSRTVLARMPTWTRQIFFDIEAQPGGTDFTRDQVRLMMQSLLADRFKLAVHFETKDGPAYALVLAKPGKLGSQMKKYPDGFPCSDAPPPVIGRGGGPAPAVPTVDDGRFPAFCGHIDAMTPTGSKLLRQGGRNISMGSIIGWISTSGDLDRPLIDRTNLTGTFDLSLEFEIPVPSVADAEAGPVAQPTSSLGTSFLEAVSDQLGLKLQSITAPVSTLIIDHVEEPTQN